MGQRPGRGRRKPTPTSYAGRIPCLRCDKPFESWDRRQNRLCDACGQAIAEQPSDEPAYAIAKPRRLPRGPDDR
jgi:predicted amidophosphoribosyltransferase